MKTDIVMFDETKRLPNWGWYVVERNDQVRLVTNSYVPVAVAVSDWANLTGTFADWEAEQFVGYVESTQPIADADWVSQEMLDDVDGCDTVIYVAPLYWVSTDDVKNYLVTHECIDPFTFEIGVDVVISGG